MKALRYARALVLTATGALAPLSPCRGQTLNVWPGVAPGSARWTQREVTIDTTPIGAVVINVVVPTLTAFLPDSATATGTGVIVAPGGAFVALALELEGTSVARWLQQRGIAAFVLKYRTVEHRQDGIPSMDLDTAGRYARADVMQAVRVLRARAADFRVRPDRIGLLGFSAGAMASAGALVQADSADRPNFVALIYGAPFGALPTVPRHLPPVFMAWAQDDRIASVPATRFRDALVAAGNRPTVHVYRAGGHGFGLRHQGTESDAWTTDLWSWLTRQD